MSKTLEKILSNFKFSKGITGGIRISEKVHARNFWRNFKRSSWRKFPCVALAYYFKESLDLLRKMIKEFLRKIYAEFSKKKCKISGGIPWEVSEVIKKNIRMNHWSTFEWICEGIPLEFLEQFLEEFLKDFWEEILKKSLINERFF